jgi:hypothetical protein
MTDMLAPLAPVKQSAAAQHAQLMLALPVETVERITEALLLELTNRSPTVATSSNSSNNSSSDAVKQQSEAAATVLFSGALSSTTASSAAVVGVLKHALSR